MDAVEGGRAAPPDLVVNAAVSLAFVITRQESEAGLQQGKCSVPYYRDWTFMRSITEGYTRGDTSHPRGGRIPL